MRYIGYTDANPTPLFDLLSLKVAITAVNTMPKGAAFGSQKWDASNIYQLGKWDTHVCYIW